MGYNQIDQNMTLAGASLLQLTAKFYEVCR
jgi:hypothetical protein